MTTLLFKNKNLHGILKITEQSSIFRATYDESVEAFEKDTGSKHTEESLENYYEHSNPKLWLVEEEGIYIMTSAKMHSHPNDNSHVCYAEGYQAKASRIYDSFNQPLVSSDLIISIEFTDQLKKGIIAGADLQIEITEEYRTIMLVFPGCF